MTKRSSAVLAAIVLSAALVACGGAALAQKPKACARPDAGAEATPAPALVSRDGHLDVSLGYFSSIGDKKRVLYCFVTPDGQESPTLYVKPGDTLNINLTNQLPPPEAGASSQMVMDVPRDACGDSTMDASSVNMHFHGTNTTPTCHSDEVLRTLVNSGGQFTYQIKFPTTEPPGLYWYHPHVHGQAEAAVLGGATGAIVVEGLQKIQPEVAGLPERVLTVRDQIRPGLKQPGGRIPSWDISLNYVPIDYPANTPSVITVQPGRRELWRVLNASADTVLNLHLKYDGVDQPLEVVGLDGVPTGSQDGTGRGKAVWEKHILIPTAGRAEFIVKAPSRRVQRAVFETDRVDTGPAGDNDPTRILAVLSATPTAEGSEVAANLPIVPKDGGRAPPQLFDGLDNAKISARRTLYFSERFEGVKSRPRPPIGVAGMAMQMHANGAPGGRDEDPYQFYITVRGQRPQLFDAFNPPAITTTQGSVEEWTIQNTTEELHEFHIHQIHFKLIKRNGILLPPDQQQYLDTVQVPFWSGHGPKPSVTVLMDFRGNITGDFVYHCHILEHEDGGMMATIRVLPKAGMEPKRNSD